MIHLVDIPYIDPNRSVTLHSKIVFVNTQRSNYGYRKKLILRKKKFKIFLSVFSFSFEDDFIPEKIYQPTNT